MTHAGRLLYDLLKPLVGVALHWYYRGIQVAQPDRIPNEGPVFLAPNHPNALTDALVVGWAAPRRVRFTAKATLFANPAVARLLSAVGVVPLRRAADEALAGRPATEAERNAAAFSAVADALAESACVVLFPEGKTTDDPYLSPIRTGLARMALMARDDRGVTGIRIVPMGLLFEDKAAPRSAVLLQVGDPIAVDQIPAGDGAVATLTALIEQRIRALTLNFESTEDAERIRLVSDTLQALIEPTLDLDEPRPPLSSTMRLIRRIERAQGQLAVRDEPQLVSRVAHFEARLRALRDRLAAERIDVHDLTLNTAPAAGSRLLRRELALAVIMTPISAWGRITHLVPLWITRRLATRNVQSLDEPATRSFVIGIVLVLLWYLLLLVVAVGVVGPWWALLLLLSFIPAGSADLRYRDRVQRGWARARAYRRFRRDPALQAALLAEAEWIRREAGALAMEAEG